MEQEAEVNRENQLNEEIRIRASEIIALGKSGDREAIRQLVEILENKSEIDWLRGCAAIALGRISGEEVMPALITALKAESPLVARTAILALSDTGSQKALPALKALLDDKSKQELHPLTINVLKTIGGHKADSTLLQALDNPAIQVRRNAALALGDLRTKAAVGPFIKMMSDSDECLRAIIASALGLIGDQAAYQVLAAALNDSTETVRAVAASSLGCLGDVKAVALLEKAKDDSSEIVRQQAAVALAKLKSKK
jgi:HEAT repeat protein